MKKIVLFGNLATDGIEAGINIDGDLYFGNESSGYNLPDTPNNRERIKRDYQRYKRDQKRYESGCYAT